MDKKPQNTRKRKGSKMDEEQGPQTKKTKHVELTITKSKQMEELKYYPGDRGPFVVIITQNDNEKLNELRIVKILMNDLKLTNNNIFQIRSVRNGGVKVIMKNSK